MKNKRSYDGVSPVLPAQKDTGGTGESACGIYWGMGAGVSLKVRK
jgi:hypothetical protein